MEVDDPATTDANPGSAGDVKSHKTPQTENGKRMWKLYVGSQSLGFRQDHMEVNVIHILCVALIYIATSSEMKYHHFSWLK